jgi:hypothetical protein
MTVDDGFLRVIKVCSKTSFRGDVKPGVKILWHVNDPYSMKRDTCNLNSWAFLTKVIPASLLGVSAGYCQSSSV